MSLPRSKQARPQSVPAQIARERRDRCPVNDPNMGMITENDHRVGLCPCPMCTCGKHVCPAKIQKTPYPKDTYKSFYNSEYHNKRQHKPHKFSYISAFIPTRALDFTTSYQQNFAHIPPNQEKFLRLQKTQGPRPEFMGSSSYQKDFPVHNGAMAVQYKRPNQSHTSGLPLNAKSQYQQNYAPLRPEDLHKAKQDAAILKDMRTSTQLKPQQAKMSNVTITRQEFADFSKANQAKREGNKYDTILNRAVPKSQYSCEYRDNYIKFSNLQTDHRLARRNFDKSIRPASGGLNKTIM